MIFQLITALFPIIVLIYSFYLRQQIIRFKESGDSDIYVRGPFSNTYKEMKNPISIGAKTIKIMAILFFMILAMGWCTNWFDFNPEHTTEVNGQKVQEYDTPPVKEYTPMPDAKREDLLYPEATMVIVNGVTLPEGYNRYNDAFVNAVDRYIHSVVLTTIDASELSDWSLIHEPTQAQIDTSVDEYLRYPKFRDKMINELLNLR
jgi:hypothetical protein